jgi:hypothetical protein
LPECMAFRTVYRTPSKRTTPTACQCEKEASSIPTSWSLWGRGNLSLFAQHALKRFQYQVHDSLGDCSSLSCCSQYEAVMGTPAMVGCVQLGGVTSTCRPRVSATCLHGTAQISNHQCSRTLDIVKHTTALPGGRRREVD